MKTASRVPGARLSEELKNVIVYLERQKGVTSVTQGRYTRSKHHHKPGWVRVSIASPTDVHLRAYDKLGCKDLFVYAARNDDRDRWVATLSGGEVVTGDMARPPKERTVKPASIATAVPTPIALAPAKPKPAAIETVLDDRAGQIIDVTPALAEQWLERNTRNRDLRQNRVDTYASDMQAGRWMLTNDAIAFDTNGCVINGQHRLWAVVLSGKTVAMLVVRGLDPDAVMVMDDNLGRKMQDAVNIQRPGAHIGTKHAAIVNLLVNSRIEATATDKAGARKRITRQTQIATLDRHYDAIMFTVRDVFKSRNVKGITTAVMAPVTRAYYTQDHDRLRAFGLVLLDGITEDPDDRPALVLRNYLFRALSNNAKARAQSDVVYRKVERALLAFCEREQLSTLYEAPNELFPLPEEQTGRKK